MEDADIAIQVNGVSKIFKLPLERNASIKSSLINFRRRGKYETQQALKDVTFEVKKGEFFGIVGRNGSGKSTLLKIIAGIYQPTAGRVGVNGKLVPFIELGVGFNPELTGRENVFLNGALLGFSTKEVSKMYKDIVEFAELKRFMDQKLKNYSSGMQVRLAFSMAVRAEADVLLIDEVLAVGDADFQRKCFEYFKSLKRDKTTVIFVSHDMSAIRSFCDRALMIENGSIYTMGGTAEVANQYSMLFIDTDKTDQDSSGSTKSTRWGNGDIKITKAVASVVKEEIVVNVKTKARKAIEGVMYGLHIVAQDGAEVVALNNRLIGQPDLNVQKSGSEVEFTWKMLNVFNDGKYFVTLTLVDEAGLAFDWVVDAASFTVKRAERSTTNVLPPIAVKYKVTR